MLSICLNNQDINIDTSQIIEEKVSNTVFSSLIKKTSSSSAHFKISIINNYYELKDPWKEVNQFSNIEELIYTLEWKIVDYIIEQNSNFLQFHGASLMQNDEGFTFIGNPRTGKTSLSILLLRKGFSFLSDEVTLIDNNTKLIYPFPRNLIIKQHLLDKIKIPSGALSIKIDGDTNKKETAFFLSPNIFGNTTTNSVKIKKIFFLQESAQKNLTIDKIGQHEAFNQILPQLFNPQFLHKNPEAITELLSNIDCYNLFINKPLHFDEKQIQELLTKIING